MRLSAMVFYKMRSRTILLLHEVAAEKEGEGGIPAYPGTWVEE